ncbi:MAG: CoA transferase [Burkholderiaceae bacterium]|nr:CoA transferase [Burkholderiaceae bacterium]
MNAPGLDTDPASAPLAGLRVLDLSELLPGPYATSLLADLGAEVIKVERPGGDNARAIVPDMVESLNRGKRGICIDLKTDAGRAVLRRLAERSDVLVEGFRPGVARRLGVDQVQLCALNPRLIYVSVSGYGATGPQAQRPGHDLNYLSAVGVVGLTQRGGAPTHDVNIPVADIAASMFAVVAILAALAQRGRDGHGQFLDVAITDAALHWTTPRLGPWLAARARGSAAATGLPRPPAYGVYQTADGRHLSIGAIEDPFFSRLVVALGLKDLQGPALARHHDRVAHGPRIDAAIAGCLQAQPLAHWIALFDAEDIPCAPVNNLDQVLTDPHFVARGMVSWVDGQARLRFPVALRGLPMARASAPAIGEHTCEILAELGLSADALVAAT